MNTLEILADSPLPFLLAGTFAAVLTSSNFYKLLGLVLRERKAREGELRASLDRENTYHRNVVQEAPDSTPNDGVDPSDEVTPELPPGDKPEATEPNVVITNYYYGRSDQDVESARLSDSLAKQEKILLEIYTQGLGQARSSFTISYILAVGGALLLFAGILLAIFFAGSTGERYVSIVTGSVGVVISVTSGVFFVQSNRSQTALVSHGVQLREESREDRRLTAARDLTNAIADDVLRDQVRADLARGLLQLSAMPQAVEQLPPVEPAGTVAAEPTQPA